MMILASTLGVVLYLLGFGVTAFVCADILGWDVEIPGVWFGALLWPLTLVVAGGWFAARYVLAVVRRRREVRRADSRLPRAEVRRGSP